MFGNIKQGNIVYVLIKGEKPVVKIGQVESVTNPTPKYPTYNPSQPFGTTPEMQLDVKVKCGEEVIRKYRPIRNCFPIRMRSFRTRKKPFYRRWNR